MQIKKQSTRSRKKVMVFGTFDIIHEGHRHMFKQAKQYGDYLIVSIARVKNIKILKNVSPLHSEQERLAAVQKEALVDKCFLGEIDDPFFVIKREKPDIIALGYDQKHSLAQQLPEKLKEMGLADTKIVQLKAYKPEIYKSSKIREQDKKVRKIRSAKG
ncbi:MAG: adenylyltransferase/cytidyltransferase family protein [Candidatus Gracilibacteria bacterium]|nr:adenylyltransferase/cytidyltransferase family protein [Candidatus Gracilibacteria bacterium]